MTKGLVPLFADCGTATALTYDGVSEQMSFNMSAEGENYDAIITPEGGSRKPIHEKSNEYIDVGGGNLRKGYHLVMKGLDVFNFSLQKVVPNIDELINSGSTSKEKIDYFFLHQANKMVIESIAQKLGVDMDSVPISLKDYGNTSCATIPLTIVGKLAPQNKIVNGKMLLAGFGVGLSLGSALIDFKDVKCPEIIEL